MDSHICILVEPQQVSLSEANTLSASHCSGLSLQCSAAPSSGSSIIESNPILSGMTISMISKEKILCYIASYHSPISSRLSYNKNNNIIIILLLYPIGCMKMHSIDSRIVKLVVHAVGEMHPDVCMVKVCDLL